MAEKTVRVRVLVAITDDGAYLADGNSETPASKLIAYMHANLTNYMTPPIELYWLEADVPVPTVRPIPIIEAGVKRG